MSSKSHFFRQSGLNLTLVAQYDFNNNLIDSIGGNNGTGTDITYNIGSFGNEAVFNGTTSEVRTPNSTVWDISDGVKDIPIKIEVLVKFGTESRQYVLSKANFNSEGWEILKVGNLIFFNIYDTSSGGFIQVGCDNEVDVNGYTKIITTYDGSNSANGLTLSVNGLSNNLVKNTSSYTKTQLLTLDTTFGRADKRSDRRLNGAISQIKVFK